MPKPARLVILVLSILTLLTTLEGARLALTRPDGAAWGSLGFEIVIAVACVIGILLGRGCFKAGPGIAAACVAGTIFVATLFGRLEFVSSPRAIPRDLWFLGRTGLAALIGLMAAFTVLSRDRRSIAMVVRSALFFVPLVAFAAFWAATGGLWLGTSNSGGAEVARVVILLFLALVGGGLFCAGAHCLIRAFEFGVPPGQPGAPEPLPTSGAAVQAPAKSV
jgi:hypothetical protein